MDGVLLDSEPLHHRAVNEILAQERKAGLSARDYVPYMGTTDEYTWKDLIRRFALDKPFSYYLGRYDETVLELYRSCSDLAQGAAALLAEIRGRGLGLAVASSSRREWVETCLTALGIRNQFNVVVTGDMVKHSKPDPEIFLLAARCLGVPVETCLAIEDSPNGIAAAAGAGMFTVALRTPYPTNGDVTGAQLKLDSLADLDFLLFKAGVAQSTSKVRNG